MLKITSPLPAIASFCLGGLVIALLLLSYIIPVSEHSLERQAGSYGQALAKTCADRAVDAILSNDLVGLRVILQDTAASEHILWVTAHNVEHQLIVQAGKNQHIASQHLRSFSAPISVDDNIAGYITVNMVRQALFPASLKWALICGLLGLLVTLIKSLYQARTITFQPPKIHWPTLADVSPKERAEHTPMAINDTGNNEPLSQSSACAIIQIKNYPILQQQLNGDSLRKTLAELETRMEAVMQLYGGREIHWHDSEIVLHFGHHQPHQEARAEALFQALCSAHLVIELASIVNKIPLDLSALVCELEQLQSLLSDSEHHRHPFTGVALAQDSTTQDSQLLELIRERTQLMAYDNSEGEFGLQIVSNFEMPYLNLLTAQKQCLLEQFDLRIN